MSSSYAIVETGGKQYRVEKGDTLLVDRLSEDEGSKVNLRAVMFRSDGDVVIAGGDLEKVKVEAKVAGHERGPKVRVFKYKPKKGYRRRAGHRSELTRLEVTDLKMLSRKPAAKSKAKAEGGAAKAESATKAKASTAKSGAAKSKASAAKSGGTKASSGKSSSSRSKSAAGSSRRKASEKKES